MSSIINRRPEEDTFYESQIRNTSSLNRTHINKSSETSPSIQIMEEKYFTCEIHKQNFQTVDALKKHVVQYHSNDGEDQLRCPTCNKQFKSTFQFELHKRRHPENNSNDRLNQNALPRQLQKKSNTLVHTDPNQKRITNTTAATGKLKDNMTLQCHICSDFIGESNLSQHLLSHETEPLFPSSAAENDPNRSPLIKTEPINGTTEFENRNVGPRAEIDVKHNGKSFSCNTCKRVFILRKALNDHLKTHVSQVPTFTFACDKCHATFKSRCARQKHISNEHSDLEYSSEEDKDSETKDSSGDDADYQPEDGNSDCNSDDDYGIESDSSSSGKEKVLENAKDSNGYDAVIPKNCVEKQTKINAITVDKKNRCYFCYKKHLYPKDLLRHIQTHTKERPFVCQMCQNTFGYERPLDIHNLRVHGIPIPKRRFDSLERCVPCSMCKKSFYNAKDLYRHMTVHGIKPASTHKPFGCHLCKSVFKVKQTLRKHMLTHSEVRAHVCKQCKKAYKRSEGLRKHVQAAHSKERPFKCKVCSKDYNRKDVYQQHMKLHKSKGPVINRGRITTSSRPFPCKLCKRSYTRTDTLRIHIETAHSTIRPFKCKFCLKDFNYKTSYDRHVKQHEDNQLYECTICKSTFSSSNVLVQHRMTHFPDAE